MSKTDPGWIYIIVIAIIVAVLWKPVINPLYQKIAGNFSKEPQIARGKETFMDDKRWAVQNMSCATCHVQGKQAVPDGRGAMAMDIMYTPLNGAYRRLAKGALASDAAIAAQINKCISMAGRLASPQLSTSSDTMKDMIEYIKTIK